MPFEKKNLPMLVLTGVLIVALVVAVVFIVQNRQAEQVAGTEKRFGDVDIVFFPGGSEGCPFASVVFRGAKAAGEDLGVNVEFVWSDWQPERMIAQFKEAVARRPDGIAIMGHPGVAAFAPLVDEAKELGIIVTSQNTDLPDIESKYKATGFGYVGQNLYASGVNLGKGAAQRAGLQSGDRVMVMGLLALEVRGLRTKGVIDALEELGMTVDYIEISREIDADPSLGAPVISSFIAANPDVRMIVMDHGALTASLGVFLEGAGVQPGEIFGAGFDLSPATLEAIRGGWVGAVLDQQPWLQGYLPVLQLALSEKYGFAGLHIDTGAAIVDETNVEFLAPLVEEGIR
jgi:simple sugar transport system substrate-binding protein